MEPESSQVAEGEDREVRKKPSMLSEVLMTGLLKNINDKVANKLDQEAQSELAGIVSQKVKQSGLVDEEGGISFDDLPSQEHLLSSANKGRVSPPRNRLSRTERRSDSLEDDFESLLRDEEIDIADNMVLDITSEELDGELGGGVGGGDGDDSYLDDFEALLASSSGDAGDCDEEQHCDIEADFDALIEKENVVVQKQICNTSEIVPEISQSENVSEDQKNENKWEELDDQEPEVEVREDDDEALVCDENINEESNPANQAEETEQQELSKPVIEKCGGSLSGDLEQQEESISNLEVVEVETINQNQQPVVEGKEVADSSEHVQAEGQTTAIIPQLELGNDDEDHLEEETTLKAETEENQLLIKVEEEEEEEEEDRPSVTGMKVIVPTMEILDQAMLEQEIQEDSREAELLIQLKHLNSRVEAQDTLLAELKEENTVLKIQNQNLLESLNKINSRPSLFRKSSKEYQSLEYQDLDETTERKKMFLLEQELEDQKEVNKQLKAYVGDVLINIIVQNPDILEKKSQQ